MYINNVRRTDFYCKKYNTLLRLFYGTYIEYCYINYIYMYILYVLKKK